jgi:RecB family exonuclease
VRVLGSTGASIEELLWCVWEASKLSELWAADALGSGLLADDANRNLDSVMALFTSAKRFVEREPHRPAGDFISELLAADIPEDTLAAQAVGESVLVCTPAAVVGAEFDVVVIASLQEGIWPNLRLRGSLLHPQEIVDAQFGGIPQNVDDRKQVVEDELRMFALSLSRAQTHVIVSATRDDDALPSPFFRLLKAVGEPSPEWNIDASSQRDVPLSLRGIVGSLRRSLASSMVVSSPSPRDEVEALSSALAELAEADVPGASPEEWYGMLGPSTPEPLVDFDAEPDVLVSVSPSKLEAWEKNQLGWFISSTVGSQSSAAMGVGSLFHSVIEAVGLGNITVLSPESLWKPIEQRWHELAFDAPWESIREKRRAFKMVGALSAYLTEFAESGAEVVAVECEFTVPVGHARLHGFIDRVEQDRDGNIVIVDLKTGGIPSASHAEENPQLLCYQFALAHDGIETVEAGSRSGGARLLYLRGKQKSIAAQSAEELEMDQPFTYKTLNQGPLTNTLDAEGNDPLEAMEQRIREAAVGMAGGVFSAVVYTREERGEYDSRYESRIHIMKAVSS